MRRMLVIGLVAAVAGCDLFGPSGPGTLDATLTTQTPLGAVVLEITGPAVTGVSAQGDTRAFSAVVDAAAGRHRVVLVAPGAGPMRFGIDVDDLGAESPAVAVITAAGLDDLPALATGIEIRVER
ncbi:MAG: hypothetical protein RH859_06705 [Longimicrobiales bacterium]